MKTYKNGHPKKVAMIEALKKSLGVISGAIDKVGIARQTHYDWMRLDDTYRKAVETLGDYSLDFVETQLFRQISEGNVTATIFYLKTKGRNRGYVERREYAETDTQGNEVVSITKEDREEILKALKVGQKE